MATRAIPEALEWWEAMLQGEEGSGAVDLPIIDWIRMSDDGLPSMVVIGPGRVPAVDSFFVDVDTMAPADRVALDALLDALSRRARVRGLGGVFHLGGLDYSFCDRNQNVVSRLLELRREDQPRVWGLLRAIARLGAENPDREASAPRMTRE